MQQALIQIPAPQHDVPYLETWLGKYTSRHTRMAYARDIARFYTYVQKSVCIVTLRDVQDFSITLSSYALTTQARIMMAVKSWLTFCRKLGYIPVNVGELYTPQKPKNTLAERILTETQVLRLLALETDKRNHAILYLLYMAGIRAEELCTLKWRDLQERGDAGQITVYGKRNKTRTILLTPEIWQVLQDLRRAYAMRDEYVFQSRKGTNAHRLSTTQVFRIVRNAATRAGILDGVSPHWLRHSHATHAIERGAPLPLVKETLGHEKLETVGRYLHARPQASSAQYLIKG